MESGFFGLTLASVSEFEIARIMEPEFALMYYGGFTYSDIQDIPVQKKIWHLERIQKEIAKGAESGAGTRGLHQNTEDIRSLQGRTRPTGPSRTKRFT